MKEDGVETNHDLKKNYNCRPDRNEWEKRWVAYNVPGQYYYGRGCLQLSWTFNYYEASKDLFGDGDELLKNADQVETNRELCWLTAAWFWKERVKTELDVNDMSINSTTQIINKTETTNHTRHRQEIFDYIMKN